MKKAYKFQVFQTWKPNVTKYDFKPTSVPFLKLKFNVFVTYHFRIFKDGASSHQQLQERNCQRIRIKQRRTPREVSTIFNKAIASNFLTLQSKPQHIISQFRFHEIFQDFFWVSKDSSRATGYSAKSSAHYRVRNQNLSLNSQSTLNWNFH